MTASKTVKKEEKQETFSSQRNRAVKESGKKKTLRKVLA
jgi:hypothetical protein